MAATIEDAIQAAKQGDVGAMCALGNYYCKEEGYTEATKWYEMAAERGIPYAIDIAASLRTLQGHALADMTGFKDGEKEFQIAYSWYSKLLRCIDAGQSGTESFERAKVLNNYLDCIYSLAVCKYWTNQKNDVIQLTEAKNEKRFQILNCWCKLDLVAPENVETAVRRMIQLVTDHDYMVCKKEAWEEHIYAMAVVFVAETCYRQGNVVSANINKAADLLMSARNAMHHQMGQKTIADELQHYKKKLFGGYRYVK